MQKETIIINSYVNKLEGDDTQFTIDLKRTYSGKMLSLEQFIVTNLFSNLNEDDGDFSYQTAGNNTTYKINQLSLTLDQIFQKFNEDNILQLQYVNKYGILTIQTANATAWRPRGKGWLRLGISQAILDGVGFVNSHQGTRYFDVTGTNYINVVFENIQNAFYTENQTSFTIPVSSAFGSPLIYDVQNVNANQQIVFSESEFQLGRNLRILLQDDQYRKMTTQNNNNVNLQIFMRLSFYK